MSIPRESNVYQPRHVWDAHAGYQKMLGGEWLLTDGCGGYAAGTALGINTRRYHGLLAAASHPPVGRMMCLNQVLEQLVLTAPSERAPSHPGSAQGLRQTIDLTTMLFTDGQGRRLHIPDGYARLRRFEKGLSVCWHYRWGQVSVSRRLWMHFKPGSGRAAVTLRYRIGGLAAVLNQPGAAATLRLGPMITARDFHGLIHREDAGPTSAACRQSANGPAVTVHRGSHAVTLRADYAAGRHGTGGGSNSGSGDGSIGFVESPDWWYAIEYPIDARRGQDSREDYFLPGHFEVPLGVSGDANQDQNDAVAEVTLTATLGTEPAEAIAHGRDRAEHLQPIAERLRQHAGVFQDDDEPAEQPTSQTQSASSGQAKAWTLAQASDDFIVDRWLNGRRLSTILAGYPWFADWGRDAFIALPGLLLATGRNDEARQVLHAFAHALGTGPNRGLIPNRFDDYDPGQGAAHYNTVDASLWYIVAALKYVQTTGRAKELDDWLGRTCVAIVDAYLQGTGQNDHGPCLIRMDDDGLLDAGTAQTQLTWMDAAAHLPGHAERTVFTPRQGKAVEINALWHHVLRGLSRALPERLNDKKHQYAQLADRVGRSFTDTFARPTHGGLIDHVTLEDGQAHEDPAIRPNQIFAVSLPDSPLSQAEQTRVLGQVREKLLTPMGLRTLAEDDPNFHRIYAGPQFERDAAYHQGCIWPWLIGPYAEAVLRAGRFSQSARHEARNAIGPLFDFLCAPNGTGGDSQGIGQLYEIHEPTMHGEHYPPRGCFAQAWSVAELIRVLDLLDRD